MIHTVVTLTTPVSAGAPQEAADLSADEQRAWRLLLSAHAYLTRQLGAELEAETGLTLPAYEVLVYLSEAPEGQLRMHELASGVLLSRSGLTRLADRLEQDGLIARTGCVGDARGRFAALTEAGWDRLRGAYPVHLRGVRAHVVDRMDGQQLVALADALGTLVAR